MSTSRVIVPLLLLVFLTTGCGSHAPLVSKKPVVVSTFSVLNDWVKAVAGDAVELETLVPAGLDPHTFEITPAQTALLNKANLVFEIGLNFEPWMEASSKASGLSAKRIRVAQGITPITLSGPHGEETDPHIWHDPMLAAEAVRAISQALAEAIPESAPLFRENAQQYIDELVRLDGWIAGEVQKIPPERRKLVTSHDTFGYFARRYQFNVLGSAFGSISTEIADPSAQHVAEVIRQIQSAGVPAVFCENIQNPKLMEQIARESKTRLASPLYTDALGAPDSSGATYIQMMRSNVVVIVEALRQ